MQTYFFRNGMEILQEQYLPSTEPGNMRPQGTNKKGNITPTDQVVNFGEFMTFKMNVQKKKHFSLFCVFKRMF